MFVADNTVYVVAVFPFFLGFSTPKISYPLMNANKSGIDNVCLRRDHAVRVVLVCFQRAVLVEKLGREWTGGLPGHDLVVIVHHLEWNW